MASIFFELLQLGRFTVTGTLVKSAAVDWEFDTNYCRITLSQIMDNGVVQGREGIFETTEGGSTHTKTAALGISTGRYRIDLAMRTELSFPLTAPQALDVTAAASQFRVTVIPVIPEPSTATILLTGLLASGARRKWALQA
jgi:hypothetical protein